MKRKFYCEVNMRKLQEPTLKNYVARYKIDKRLLEKHPEGKEMLERRIAKHEKDIVAYVTSEKFEAILNSFC